MPQIDIGAVISNAITVLQRGAPKFTFLSLIVYLPYILFLFFGPQEEFYPGATYGQLYASIVGILLAPLLTAVLLYEVVMRLRGETAAIGRCLQAGRRRYFPVLALTIVLSLAYALGIIFFLLPFFIFAALFAVAIPVCVLEGVGPFRSMDRSVTLTKGARLQVLAVVLLQGFLWGGLSILNMIAAFAGIPFWAQMAVNAGVTIGGYMMQAVISGALYHEIRTMKEGAADADLVAIFS